MIQTVRRYERSEWDEAKPGSPYGLLLKQIIWNLNVSNYGSSWYKPLDGSSFSFSFFDIVGLQAIDCKS